MDKKHIIKGDDGRTYERRENGTLREVYVREDHAKRLLSSITVDTTVTGLRLTDAKNPDAPATVVTFDADEAKIVVAAVKRVLEARAKG